MNINAHSLLHLMLKTLIMVNHFPGFGGLIPDTPRDTQPAYDNRHL